MKNALLNYPRKVFLLALIFPSLLWAQSYSYRTLNPKTDKFITPKNIVKLGIDKLSTTSDHDLKYEIRGKGSLSKPIRLKVYAYDESVASGLGTLLFDISSYEETPRKPHSYEYPLKGNNPKYKFYPDKWMTHDIKSAALATMKYRNVTEKTLPVIIEITTEGEYLESFEIPGIGDIDYRNLIDFETTQKKFLSGEGTKFAMIGDFGWEGPNARAVSDLVKSWNVDFIVTQGDDDYQDKLHNNIDRNIGQYYWEYIYPYKGNYGAGNPKKQNAFFPTLGNHSYKKINGQPNDYLLNIWLDYFTLPTTGNGERYYDYVKGDIHFFHMNWNPEEPDGRDSNSVQAQWLKNKLAASTSKFKIVNGHQTPYSSGFTDSKDHGSLPILQWPFKEWGATLVVSGHEHIYERIIVNDINYVVNGLGGAPLANFIVRHPNWAEHVEGQYGAIFGEAKDDILTLRFATTSFNIKDEFSIRYSPPSKAHAEYLTRKIHKKGQKVAVMY